MLKNYVAVTFAITLLFYALPSRAELATPGKAMSLTVDGSTRDPNKYAFPYEKNDKGEWVPAFSKDCEEFIRPDGSFGETGLLLLDAMYEAGSECFFKQVDYSIVCPAYEDLPHHDKNGFIIWLFAAMAQKESSCDPKATNPQGATDTAVGLFQMEKTKDQRVDAGRDKVMCRTHTTDRPDVYSIKFQTRCTASIFRDWYCHRPNQPGKDFAYWHELNSESGWITQMARKFPGCNVSNLAPKKAVRPKSRPNP